MVSVKGYIKYVLFESGSVDIEEVSKLMVCLEDLLKIVSGLEIERSMTSTQTKAYKNENQARAEALKIASLENLTATDKELTKNSMVVELESSIAKKQPANIFLPEMYWVL